SPSQPQPREVGLRQFASTEASQTHLHPARTFIRHAPSPGGDPAFTRAPLTRVRSGDGTGLVVFLPFLARLLAADNMVGCSVVRRIGFAFYHLAAAKEFAVDVDIEAG